MDDIISVFSQSLLNQRVKTENILHGFRSYNYVFTLACLEKSEIRSRKNYADSELKYVIAKSSGKGFEGLNSDVFNKQKTSTDPRGGRGYNLALANKNAALLEGFNTSSPGRFDFYFSDVELNNLLTANENSGMSKATSINFTIIEPYSINGFTEALQAAAVSAGYATFRLATYLLKIEFIGYPDSATGDPAKPMKIEPASRYFPVVFSDMAVSFDEGGARYSCKTLPVNELGFGDLNKLTTSIKMSGNTVGAILEDFIKGVNASVKQNYTSKHNESVQTDTYKILFPEDPSDPTSTTKNRFYSAKVADLSLDNLNYKFDIPVRDAAKKSNSARGSIASTINGKTLVAQFKDGTNIHDCITSILRDCSSIQDIFKNKEASIDSYGLVEYFYVHCDVKYSDKWSQELQRYFYEITFSVIPYKIHYTKIWGSNNQKIQRIDNLKSRIRRTYNWIYTGKNIDILKFNLDLNYLYFQAVPKSLGTSSDDGDARGSAVNISPPVARINSNAKDTDDATAKEQGYNVATGVDVRLINSQSMGPGAALGFENNPYLQLSRNLHRAILDNVSAYKVNLEIIGDPFYIVQGGIGNTRPTALDKASLFEITTDGEANHISGDIHVYLNFQNPVDYDKSTGLMKLNQNTPFSGVYYVASINSRFSEGQFKQTLELLRLPNQEGPVVAPTLPSTAAASTFIFDIDFDIA